VIEAMPEVLKPRHQNANKGIMKTTRPLLYVAWKKLLAAYLFSFAISLLVGTLLVKIGHVQPERLYEISTKRLSYALPVFDKGSQHGIDMGLLLFVWNAVGALLTLSFVYSAALFNPHHIGWSPKWVRKIFCGKARMKLFCYLPGCATIEEESLRRLYVWLMVPCWVSFYLESKAALSVSTSSLYFRVIFRRHPRSIAPWSD
jgi:hypothetical protein